MLIALSWLTASQVEVAICRTLPEPILVNLTVAGIVVVALSVAIEIALLNEVIRRIIAIAAGEDFAIDGDAFGCSAMPILGGFANAPIIGITGVV